MSTEAEQRYFNGTIKDVDIIEPRFDDMGSDSFEIAFIVTEEGTENDVELYLEVSDRYGMGTLKDKKQSTLTVETLKGLGYQHDYDFSRVNELIGAPCRVRAKLNAKGTRMNYYFTSSKRESLSPEEIAKRTRALMGQAPMGQAPAQAKSSKPAEADPFADSSEDAPPF